MAGGTVGALRITLGANTANFEAGMKRAKREAANSATAIQRSLGSIKGAFGGLGTALIGGATIAGLAALTKRSLEYASSLAEVAQQVGVTAKDLQVLRFAGSQVGISTEEMDKGLQKFTKSLGDARNGSAEAIKTFKAIGFSDADIKRLDVHDALLKTADGISKVGDRAARASPEVRLFGKAGQQLDTLLSQGSRGINELTKSAEKLGIVLSDEQIQHADETADKLSALKQVLEARIAGVVADNAQGILALANSLAKLAGGLASFWGQNPQRAMAIIGAIGGGLAGLRLGGGIPGAIGGAIFGGILGHDLTPDSVANLRNTAKGQITEAQRLARARGYYDPGISAAKKKLILQDPLIVAHTEAARKALAQIRSAQAGSIAAPTPIPPSGGGFGDFLKSPGPKGKTADQIAAERERLEKERLNIAHDLFSAENQGKQDVLQAQEDIINDYEQRARIETDLVNLQEAAKDEEIDHNLAMIEADRTISDAQKRTAEAVAQKEHEANQQVSAYHREAIADEVAAQKREDALNKLETGLDIQASTLQLEENLAQTAKERRDIELRLLDIAERQERARLEAVIADEKLGKATKAQADLAQDQLNALNAQHNLKRAGIIQSTRGPLEEFQAGLPTTADKMNEALQNVAVNGLGALEQGILDVISGTKSLASAFREMASQIIAELLRIQIQRAIIGPLSNLLGGLIPGGGGGTIASLAGDSARLIAANPGIFATGGYTGNMPAHRVAGLVHGREYVFDAAATQRIGVGNLEAIRKGSVMPANDGRGDVYNMPININAQMTRREARETAAQAASAFQNRLAQRKRQGY